MDVSNWTIEQRMRLPDWCFGTRMVTSTYNWNVEIGTFKWEIGSLKLPDPACIWALTVTTHPDDGAKGNLRIGLNPTVPTSHEEMDGVTEIFPHYGNPHAGPNEIVLLSGKHVYWTLPTRKGIETKEYYLVSELNCTVPVIRVDVALTVSGLPTSMAGWLAHSKV